MSANIQQLHAGTFEIQGYLDAVEAGRLYGWVWDRKQPDISLAVEVQLDGKAIATGTADRPREDLVAGKIGNGHHAFEIDLPGGLASEEQRRLAVLVRPSAEAEPVPLGRRPASAAVPAGPDATTITWLTRILKALESLSASQKSIQKQTHELLRQVTAASKPEPDALGSPLEQSIIDLHTAQQTLEKQISGIEVFLLRFDNTLQELAARQIEKPAVAHDRKLYRMLAVSSTVAAVAFAIGLFAIFGGRI